MCRFLATSHPIPLPTTSQVPFEEKPLLYCACPCDDKAGPPNMETVRVLAPFRNTSLLLLSRSVVSDS